MRLKTLLTISILYFMLCGFSLFQPLVKKNEDGNKKYREQNYEEALKSYTDALLESPESPQLHYNISNVLYNQKKYKDAISELEKTLSTDNVMLQGKAYYNMGNCAFQEGEYDKAIDYYKKALEIDPNDEDAKFNLEFTRQKLKEMMQNQQQNQENQQQQQQEQQQSEQQQQSQGSEGQQDQQKQEEKQEGQQEQEGEEKQGAQASPTPAAGASATPQPQPTEGEEGSSSEQEEGITEEEAMSLLRSMDDYEKENQKEMIKRMMPSRGEHVDKDW